MNDEDLDFKIEMESPRNSNESTSMGSSKKENASAVVSIESGKKGYTPKFLQGAAHPGFCILHLVFKVLAIAAYLLLGLVMNDKTFCFILVVTLCALDFWVVKNLTGR